MERWRTTITHFRTNTSIHTLRSSPQRNTPFPMNSLTILWKPMNKKSKTIPQYIFFYSAGLDIYEQNYQRNAGILPDKYHRQLQRILIVRKARKHIWFTLALASRLQASQEPSRHQPQERQSHQRKEVLQWLIRRRTKWGIEKVRSHLWRIHSKDHPVGKLSVRIHRWSDANGNGGQPNRKLKRRSADVHSWEQSGIDAWEVADRGGGTNDQLYFLVYWSLTLPERKDNRRLIYLMFRRVSRPHQQ